MTARHEGAVLLTCSVCEQEFWAPVAIDAENGPSAAEMECLPDVCHVCEYAMTDAEAKRIQDVWDREQAGTISHEQAMEEIYDLAAEPDQAIERAADKAGVV